MQGCCGGGSSQQQPLETSSLQPCCGGHGGSCSSSPPPPSCGPSSLASKSHSPPAGESDADGEGAYSHGFSAGFEAGQRTAYLDGLRLGRLHGTAFGGELGSLESFTEVLSLLCGGDRPPALGEGGGEEKKGGPQQQQQQQQQDGSSRLCKSAEQVRELVAGLCLVSGAPLPASVDCVDALQRCRAKAKVCCALAALPPASASLAGWSVAGRVVSSELKQRAAALDF